MDEIHRYLKSLGIPLAQPAPQSNLPRISQPATLPNSRMINHPFGSVCVIVENIPLTDPARSFEIPVEIIQWLGLKKPNPRFSVEDFLFIDVETSGEYGGAGVLCFLVGVGRISNRAVQLSQYLLLHPEDELAQLLELEKILLSAKGFMTYNGKSFDLPLLQARFQFHHIPSPLHEGLHIDLLQLTRKIWKNHSPNRALRTMEATVLGIQRAVDDIPGWMIPSIYRDYLLTQDTSFLTPILYHNKMDVLSLAYLYLHIADLFSHLIEPTPENAPTYFRLANFYQSIGETKRAILAYEACQPYLLDEDQSLHTLETLGHLYKKEKSYRNAVDQWQKAAQLGSLSAHLELAKYYERIEKDPTTAETWIRAALNVLDHAKLNHFERSKWQKELQYRLERLGRNQGSVLK
ncbi:MAG: hypothetical protein DDG59_08350 [Anaerolineae bacterium]|nr:MAG: hypothetical protein DDG59_08350 [Anaerolineae bacterium]